MQIQVNGAPFAAADALTVAQLVDDLRLAGKRLAVERNGEIVPRSRYAETVLVPDDRLEIVQAIGGG